MNQSISLGGRPIGVSGVFGYEGLRLPGLDGPSNLIIAASKPPPAPVPAPDPAAQDFDDSGDLGLGKGFNVFHVVGAPVRLAGHALAPIARAAGKTGIPQWTNRHLIKPIIEPALKVAALTALDVESAGIHTLINTFVPAPVSNLLHGLTSVAVDEIKRGIQGQPQLSAEKIVDTMISAMTFLGDGMIVVRGLLDAVIDLKSISSTTVSYLLTHWSAPPGKTLSPNAQARLNEAKGAFDLLTPALQPIVSTSAKLVADIASAGKIRKSDLQGIVGNSKVVNKILDLFGIHDGPPADVVTNISNVPIAMRPAMKQAASAAVFAAATGQPVAEAAHTALATHPATQHLHPRYRPPPPVLAPPAPPATPPHPHRHHHRPQGPQIAPSAYAPYPAVTS